MAGVLQRFGSSAGSGPEATLIASTTLSGNNVTITDWGSAAASTTADTILLLQASTDDFATSTVEVDRIEMPTGGTVLKTFGSPIRVTDGQSFRVRVAQGTPGTVSATILGQTSGGDIADI